MKHTAHSSILIIIIVLLVIALGIFGFSVWRHQQNTTSSTSTAASSHSTRQTVTSHQGTSSSASNSTCAATSLTISQDKSQGGGTAGSVYYHIVLTNTSQRTCTLTGYPGVSMVNDVGAQIGQSAKRNATTAIQTVTLAPSGTASADIQVVDNNYPAGTCQTGATQFKVYPPNDTGYLLLPVGSLTWCPGFSVSPLT